MWFGLAGTAKSAVINKRPASLKRKTFVYWDNGWLVGTEKPAVVEKSSPSSPRWILWEYFLRVCTLQLWSRMAKAGCQADGQTSYSVRVYMVMVLRHKRWAMENSWGLSLWEPRVSQQWKCSFGSSNLKRSRREAEAWYYVAALESLLQRSQETIGEGATSLRLPRTLEASGLW